MSRVPTLSVIGCVIGGLLVGVFAAESIAIEGFHWSHAAFYAILVVVWGLVAGVAYAIARRKG
jgi:hypothetical protein